MTALAERDSSVYRWAFSPLYEKLEIVMEFRLTYEGLLMHKGGADHKHEIRKRFHRQLKRLWDIHPALVHVQKFPVGGPYEPGTSYSHNLAKQFTRCGYRFAPLATASNDAVVSLEILFLRSGRPGAIVLSADLDGRLKTLLDALRMPAQLQEIGTYTTPDPDEDPFFCLMEDDKLVGNVTVTTDTLLEPTAAAKAGYNETHDSRVVIAAKINRYGNDAGIPY